MPVRTRALKTPAVVQAVTRHVYLSTQWAGASIPGGPGGPGPPDFAKGAIH